MRISKVLVESKFLGIRDETRAPAFALGIWSVKMDRKGEELIRESLIRRRAFAVLEWQRAAAVVTRGNSYEFGGQRRSEMILLNYRRYVYERIVYVYKRTWKSHYREIGAQTAEWNRIKFRRAVRENIPRCIHIYILLFSNIQSG